MLELRKLVKRAADGRVLLDEVSLQVQPGEFVGVLGASGAGKSLTLRAIVGLTRLDGGEVRMDGERIDEAKGARLRQVRRQIGVIFQGLHLVKRLSVIENVMIGKLGSISPLRSWLYGFTDSEAREALEALARVEMADFAGRITGTLSGGEMQRVAIARAIFQKPRLYLADEPIASLDPKNAEAIMRLLRGLAQESPVLGAFHQPEMTARFCSRAVGLRRGRVVFEGAASVGRAVLGEIYGAEWDSLAPEREHAAP